MGIGWARLGGEGIPDAPEDGNIYGRQDGAWVVIPPGTTDTVPFEFSRGGNTNTGAPIGPDSGANNAPGFAVVEAMAITRWSISWRDATAGLTGGMTVTVVDPATGLVKSTTVLTAAAVKAPGNDEQAASGATSIVLAANDLVRITSNINNGGGAIVVTQVTARLQGTRS